MCVPDDSCVVFSMDDESKDGICCQNGFGSYKLFWGDTMISTGGDFGPGEDRVVGSCSHYMHAYETLASGPTSAPIECEVGFLPLCVELYTDEKPVETAWVVVDETDGENVLVGGPYTNEADAFTRFVKQACVSNDACLSFNITDSFGDGICCDSGLGYFKVSLGTETVVSGSEFVSQVKEIFGACETSAPTTPRSFTPPSESPSVESLSPSQVQGATASPSLQQAPLEPTPHYTSTPTPQDQTQDVTDP